MPSVGMVGQNGQDIAQMVMGMCGGISCYHIAEGQGQVPKPDVLVASEASPVLAELVPRMTQKDYLVVNADDRAIFPYLSARKAKLITYGFNNKACITASSVTDEGLQVCIQRTFTALDGKQHDPQEFAVPESIMSVSPEATLGAAAVWAVCGKTM